MYHIKTTSWHQFGIALDGIRNEVAEMRASGNYVSPLLYRGQSNAEWTLRTTLDRYTTAPVSLEEYFRKLAVVKPHIESFTGTTWDFDLDAATEWAGSMQPTVIPGYEFMVYLRHHGFPSPLLDWTASRQIATFFAFREPPGGEAVSLYAFCEYIGGVKSRSSGSPSISSFGPHIKGHQRHFLQQSWYTICSMFKGDGKQYFASHEEVVSAGRKDPQQDQLWKIDVSASERGQALRTLAEYNLNAHSLFGSVESLAETLGLQHFGPTA
jgi:FRG domain-containing protein